MTRQGVLDEELPDDRGAEAQRRAEQELRDSEERLRLALEAGRMGTWEWSVASGQVTWSPTLEEIHGLAPGAFGGRFADFEADIHPDDRAAVLGALAQTLEAGEEHRVEYRIVRPDGSLRWVEGRGRLYRDAAGRPERMIGICLDVTDRHQAEQALRDSERRFAQFMQQLPGLAWIKDLGGRYLYANEAAQQAFGRGEAELYGRRDEDIFPADTAAQFRAHDLEGLASEGGIQTVETLQHPDGSLHHSLVSKFPISGPGGRTAFIGGMAIDITDRKHAEERQKLLLDELNHRVRNTLAIVQSIAGQTLHGTPEPTAFRDVFSARLAALAGAHTLLTRELWQGAALYDIAETALTPFGGEGPRGEGETAVVLEGPPVTIRPNAAVTLSLVFHELATNAAKYGALSVPGGRVELTWRRTEERDQPAAVELLWRERGGPPVMPPAKRGFGSRLIAASAGQLGGKASIGYESPGLEVRLSFRPPEEGAAGTREGEGS